VSGVSALQRLDRYQREHGRLGLPLGVLYKFFDDRGTQLAATLTYYAFVALFPLLLLFFSAAGFLLQGDPTLRSELESSALRNIPMLSSQLRDNLGSFHGSTLGIVVGVLGTLYGGTGVMQVAQVGLNHIYGVPRNEERNPLRSRLRSLVLLALLGTAVLLSTGVTVALATANGLTSELGLALHALGYLFSFALALALFTGAFMLLTAPALAPAQVLRGALFAAAMWELLQVGGAAYVTHELHHANQLYGTFAIVLGTIGWIYLQSLVLVFGAELNVVLELRLWPRALLTPFTDTAELTPADRRAYSLYAAAQRFKGFEHVQASFEDQPAHAEDPPPELPEPARERST